MKTLLTRGFSASPGSDDHDDLARCSKPAGHDLAVWLLTGKMTQSLSLFQVPRRKCDQLGLGHVLSLELEMLQLVEQSHDTTSHPAWVSLRDSPRRNVRSTKYRKNDCLASLRKMWG